MKNELQQIRDVLEKAIYCTRPKTVREILRDPTFFRISGLNPFCMNDVLADGDDDGFDYSVLHQALATIDRLIAEHEGKVLVPIEEMTKKEMQSGSIYITEYTLTDDNFNNKMSRIIMNIADTFGRFSDQKIDNLAWLHLLTYCPQFTELKRLISLSYSHVDGRDLFAQLKPRYTLDIVRRIDGIETIFEADWLTDFGDQLRKLEHMIAAAQPPTMQGE